MTTPAPLPSPEPPKHADTSISGVFEAVGKTGSLAKILLAVVATLGTGGAGFITWALITLGSIGQTQAQTKAQADSTERNLDLHLKAQAAKDILDDQRQERLESERKADFKALYNAVMTRKKQPRLERMDAGVEDE